MAEPPQQSMNGPAGFWLRLYATLIDLAMIASVVALAASISASSGYYIPQEATILILYTLYSAVLLAWRGRTLGKWLCGIKVARCDGSPVGTAASIVRALATGASLCLMGLPFLLVVSRRKKRGIHDLLSGTRVQSLSAGRRRRRWAVVAFSVLALILLARHAAVWVELYAHHRAFHKSADVALNQHPWMTRSTVDASAVDDGQMGQITSWISEQAQEPGDYLVDFAGRHQVTIVGELHGRVQYLDLLNTVVDDLYHKAGVRVLALECCRSDQDAAIQDLLTAEVFRPDRALAIARKGPWNAWGYERHWDVLATVWRLNRSLPDGSEPMRVVGIFPPCDLISFRMVKRGHIYRLFRVIDDLPWLLMHDAHYARRVERQAFDDPRRTVVWVGASHAIQCCSHKVVYKDSVRHHFRMGAMLHGRYSNQVGTVLLHGESSFPTIAKLIEKCCNEAGKDRAGFDIVGSPVAGVGDDCARYVRSGVDLPFGAFVSGYVMVAGLDQIERCDWWDGFISPRMFGLYKPLYEMLCGRKLKDRYEANQYMRQGIQRL